MATLIAEDRVHGKKPFYAFSQDIIKHTIQFQEMLEKKFHGEDWEYWSGS